MTVYADGVFLLNFLVDFLLLMGAGRLCGGTANWKRALLGAAFGGVYAAACLFPGFFFLGNILWRIVSLATISLITFGLTRSALRKGLVFAFLSFALGGVVLGMGKGGVLGIVSAAGVMFLICLLGFRGQRVRTAYIPVELSHGGKSYHLTALQDTGNTLRDPVTGQQVLVVAADIASQLTGLTRQQLQKPIESLSALPGLRLIPYRCLNGSSFLLAMRFHNVRIGSWKGSTLVAFAPDGLSPDENYQALTGGAI